MPGTACASSPAISAATRHTHLSDFSFMSRRISASALLFRVPLSCFFPSLIQYSFVFEAPLRHQPRAAALNHPIDDLNDKDLDSQNQESRDEIQHSQYGPIPLPSPTTTPAT